MSMIREIIQIKMRMTILRNTNKRTMAIDLRNSNQMSIKTMVRKIKKSSQKIK